MTRPKSIPELRSEIAAARRLQESSQAAIAAATGLHQATLSRILRGQFRRCSPAVLKVCHYAHISCMTSAPRDAVAQSLEHLSTLARSRTPNARRAWQLIRLAAELLATREPESPPRRRLRRPA